MKKLGEWMKWENLKGLINIRNEKWYMRNLFKRLYGVREILLSLKILILKIIKYEVGFWS